MSAFGGVIAVNRPVDPRHGAGADRAVRRGPVRARLRRRRARDARRQAQRPAARGPGAPHPAARRHGHPPGHRRPARPGPRHRRRGPRPDGRRHGARADRGGVGRPAVRLARLRHVRSNAIVLARGGATIGIGAGQMSRVDSVRLAIEKARARRPRRARARLGRLLPVRRRPRAGDRGGITAIVQPGGSKRDADVIAAADAAGVAMVFTGRRHFRH